MHAAQNPLPLLLDSGVLCSRVVRKSQRIFQAIEKEGLQGREKDKSRDERPWLIHDPGIQQEPKSNVWQRAPCRCWRCGLPSPSNIGQNDGREKTPGFCLNLSRLTHWLPVRKSRPEVMERTADFHHEIPDACLPQPEPVFRDAAALDAAVDMLDPQPTVVQGLVGTLLFQGEFLAAEGSGQNDVKMHAKPESQRSQYNRANSP